MKKIRKFIAGAGMACLLASCGGTKAVVYMEAYAPEESGLNLVKVTDEANNTVVAGSSFKPNAYTNYTLNTQGICAKAGLPGTPTACWTSRPTVPNWPIAPA